MKTTFLIAAWIAALGFIFSGPALAGKKKKSSKTETSYSSVVEDKSSGKKNKSSSKKSSGGSTSGTYTSGAATLDHPGRLLASNCFQCHGTNGHGMESLAGKSSSDISGDMFEMQREAIGTDIMHVYAQGFTDEQIGLIADYFSKQQR